MASISIIGGYMMSVRVAGSLKADQGKHLHLIPGHIRPDGKKISSRLVFKVYANDLNGNSSLFRTTIWGRPAYSAAKGLSVGKEISGVIDLEPFQGRVFVSQGNQMVPIIGQDGQPILVDKVGLVLRNMIYGNDAAKTIQHEIQMGVRPGMWNIPGHPDWNLWEQRINERKNLKFNPQVNAQEFGYARVTMPPAGSQLVIETDEPSRREQRAAASPAPTTNGYPPQNMGGYAAPVVGGYTPPPNTMTGYAVGGNAPANVGTPPSYAPPVGGSGRLF